MAWTIRRDHRDSRLRASFDGRRASRVVHGRRWQRAARNTFGHIAVNAMRIGLFVNDIQSERPEYTTTRIALEAYRRGHEVWYISAGDFAYDPDDMIHAHARSVPPRKTCPPLEKFFADLQGKAARAERIVVDELDVLFLRNDPSLDVIDRPWAHNIGIVFGELAASRGVIVVNDPGGLARAGSKLYIQQFPAEIRPKTLITRDRDDVRHFIGQLEGDAVIKPLEGSGGSNVFIVHKQNQQNLNQMIDAVSRDGYLIVQEYLPAARRGDIRLFLLNGHPIEHKGQYAAFSRVPGGDDVRSNMHVGGQAADAKIDETVLRIAELVRPKLIRDGMFLVGLDIVGDKVMEINIFTPGGFGSARKLTGIKAEARVVDSLEQKVAYAAQSIERLDNTELATLPM